MRDATLFSLPTSRDRLTCRRDHCDTAALGRRCGVRITAVPEKIVARWSADAATRDRHTREEILARAEALAADETRYRASHKRGVKKYITADPIDPATGEIITGHQTSLSVDQARAQAEAAFDGLQVIRTSETTLTGDGGSACGGSVCVVCQVLSRRLMAVLGADEVSRPEAVGGVVEPGPVRCGPGLPGS